MTTSPISQLDAFSLAQLSERPGAKWNFFPKDVLPCWVAEMDFPLSGAVKDAIKAQVDKDHLGYLMAEGLPGVREAVVARLASRYGLNVDAEDVSLLSTTGSGIHLSVRAFTDPGDEVLLLTPLYPPFKAAVEAAGRVPVEVELINGEDGYTIDFAAMERAVTDKTSMLMLCSPHNPVGRVFTLEEVTGLADFAQKHGLTLVSDELHSDLLLDGRHIPLASLDHPVAANVVTLYGPTKTFNIPGMHISFAICRNHDMLEKMKKTGAGLATAPNILAQAATLGAYGAGDAWLSEVLAYIRSNRDYLLERVARTMPKVKVHKPAATYLAWFDLRAFDLGPKVSDTLAERAKVGVNEGAAFGAGGEGFVRFNFGTNRAVLDEALTRLEQVLG